MLKILKFAYQSLQTIFSWMSPDLISVWQHLLFCDKRPPYRSDFRFWGSSSTFSSILTIYLTLNSQTPFELASNFVSFHHIALSSMLSILTILVV